MENPLVVIASDSFKGSLSSLEAGGLMRQGVLGAAPRVRVRVLPIADGGEGTAQALVFARGGTWREVEVTGPYGARVAARYGMLDAGRAVIETAAAAGLTLVTPTREGALRASSRGLGEMILDAAERGARHLLVGLGGLATSDGGSGMARALGVRLLDADGRDVPEGVAGLESVASLDLSGLSPALKNVDVTCLSDVTSPLCGPAGAIFGFGRQKGIAPEDMEALDGHMRRWAGVLARATGRNILELPGAGAAGGLGGAFSALFGARLESGIGCVLDAIGMDEALAGADLVITGEGRMDGQSAQGKAPVGVAARARAHGVPVVAVVGSCEGDLSAVYAQGIDLVISACTAPMALEDCLAQAGTLVPRAAEAAMRAWLLGRATACGEDAARGGAAAHAENAAHGGAASRGEDAAHGGAASRGEDAAHAAVPSHAPAPRQKGAPRP